MDVFDAGVYVYRYEAAVPRSMKVVLWGPLQAKQLGLSNWTYQDGGETGFIYHATGRAIKLGYATATLIHVRQLGKAFLTVYLAGYPSDAPESQRRLDVKGLVGEAEIFLTRLAAEPIRLQETQSAALVDGHKNTTPSASNGPASAEASTPLVRDV